VTPNNMKEWQFNSHSLRCEKLTLPPPPPVALLSNADHGLLILEGF